MTQAELLARVVEALEGAGVEYMVVGSFASTLHGEPRMTRDVNLVLQVDDRAVKEFADSFDRGRFYVAALRDRSMFNIIDTHSGWKVDLIVCKDRPFSASELSRRTLADFGGVSAYVATAEDTVLAKLAWRLESRSDRQMADVVAVLAVQGAAIDDQYLDRWAGELGVAADLAEARDLATS